jgi:hypothetical protein
MKFINIVTPMAKIEIIKGMAANKTISPFANDVRDIDRRRERDLTITIFTCLILRLQ